MAPACNSVYDFHIADSSNTENIVYPSKYEKTRKDKQTLACITRNIGAQQHVEDVSRYHAPLSNEDSARYARLQLTITRLTPRQVP